MDRQLRRSFKEEIVRDLMTSTTAQEELEKEWQQLKDDREALRVIFPSGNSKVGINWIMGDQEICQQGGGAIRVL